MNKYKLTTLKNGLRVVTVPVKGHQTIAVSIFAQAGSDYESKSENGLSHFLEHMFFKGTIRRPKPIDVSREFDSIGAINNASTWNYMTAYYAKASKKHFTKILDVISDMYLNSSLPQREIEKERGVISGEIDMYNDNPMYIVQDLHTELLYGDQPAGRMILGPKENIRKFNREDFLKYREKHYIGIKTILVVSGDLRHSEVVKEAKKIFSDLKKGKDIKQEKTKINQKKQKIAVKKRKTEQSHLILSFHTPNQEDKDTHVLRVLNALFGKHMSSRLTQRIREELGLGYYVRSYYSTSYDRGLLEVDMGVDNKRAVEAVEALLEECRRIRKEKVSPAELKIAKRHLSGVRALQLESTDSLANFYGAQFSSRLKRILSPRELKLKQDKVTAEDILRVAKKTFRNSNMNLAVVGPHSKAKFQKIFRL